MDSPPKTPRSPSDPLLVVSEGEIDLLLLEELHASHDFRAWFVNELCGGEVGRAELVGAWRWVVTSLGESDLVLVVRPENRDGTLAFLIEDKIRAEFQDRQPERYRERGDEGCRQGWWDEFRTCLVAPAQYLSSTGDATFDHQLSYEALVEWFEHRPSDVRAAFKAQAFRKAIERKAGDWQRIPDETVTRFFRGYEDLCIAEFPSLGLKAKPERSAQDFWVYFYWPVGLPKSVYIIHKCDRGFVDLTFPDRIDTELKSACANFLDADMEVVQTGKSGAIRLVVPVLDYRAAFEDQVENMVICLKAVECLRVFGQAHAARLASWPAPSAPSSRPFNLTT